MFGRRDYTDDYSDRPPSWATRLMSKYNSRGFLYWKDHPGGKSMYGCCHLRSGYVFIHSNTFDETDDTRMVMLHEIAHARTQLGHVREFYLECCRLYEAEGLLEYAKTKARYAGERKVVREYWLQSLKVAS